MAQARDNVALEDHRNQNRRNERQNGGRGQGVGVSGGAHTRRHTNDDGSGSNGDFGDRTVAAAKVFQLNV